MTLNPVRQKDLLGSLGLPADAAATNSSSSGSIIAFLKAVLREVMSRLPALVNGRIPVVLANSAASSVTYATVAVTTSSAVLFASNSNRVGWWIEHKSTSNEAYILEGATATVALGKTVAADFERTNDQLFQGIINVIGSAALNLATAEYNT